MEKSQGYKQCAEGALRIVLHRSLARSTRVGSCGGGPLALVPLFLCVAVGCSDIREQMRFANSDPNDTTETTVAPAAPGSEVSLLSAFYGLDDALPPLGRFLVCNGEGLGDDGMPVIFSEEVDLESVQAGDFRVVLADGGTGQILCVTPAPATDSGEFRTILMVGDFGSAENQPVRVEITGNILSKDQRFNFRGRQVDVIPLEDGPTLILAEIVPSAEWDLGKTSTRFPFGGGSGCPESTQQVLRVVWTGGVTKPGGSEVDDVERQGYRVFVDKGTGRAEETSPFAIGDLGDGDNNHELCLDTDAPALRVEFPAGLVTDPRDDLNPETQVSVAR